MGQVLYRKYRPKGLDDVVGQEHITTTLQHALKAGTISHAYLFTGPKGVGKTSIARILAHEINGLPYTDESIHLDIIEIDAASNRRIDEIRDLRDKVHIAPTSAKYKVYIIDEVHMLTREAFNALLKTLEEPPAHVVFILATTEAHKLPETIISRTQRFTFKPVPVEKIVAHLRTIARKEKVEVSDDALALIARYGDGSFRDSISLLDQLRNQVAAVSAADVRAMLGLAPDTAITQLADALTAHDALQVVETLNQLDNQGFEATRIATQLGVSLRAQLLTGHASLASSEILFLLRELLGVAAANDPKIALELTLLNVAFNGEPAVPITATKPHPKTETVETKPAAPEPVEPQTEPAPQKPVMGSANEDELWPQVLETIKNKHNTLYSVLRMAVPRFDGDNLELGLKFSFHQKRLNEPRNRHIVADIIKELSGRSTTISCVLLEDVKPAVASATPKPAAETTTTLDAISNIFGSAELLES